MSPRLLVLAIAPLFAAATAHAQAPGEYTGGPGMTPPQPTVAADPCACSGGESVMANRWAVGLSFGSLSLAPDSNPDAKAQFAVGQISLRYRATYHLELEGTFGGGRQKLADGSEGDLAVATGTLAARYRFMVEQSWNWWLMAGLGATTVARHDASQQEVDAARRGHGTVGIGLERRFRRFAIQAELRAISLADPSGSMTAPPQVKGQPTPLGVPVNPMASGAQSGGSLTIGASYYF